jgi:hypothetical protein
MTQRFGTILALAGAQVAASEECHPREYEECGRKDNPRRV